MDALTNSLEKLLNAIKKKDCLSYPLTPNEGKKVLKWADTELPKYSDYTSALEIAAKTKLHDYCGQDDDVCKTSKLLDALLYLCEAEQFDIIALHGLIEEMVEAESIQWCERFWQYMVTREDRLCKDVIGTKNPGLTLIRYCNKLMKRASMRQYTQFTGTVAMFLARAFPLAEKSGLNKGGNYDQDNITNYEILMDERIIKEKVERQKVKEQPKKDEGEDEEMEDGGFEVKEEEEVKDEEEAKKDEDGDVEMEIVEEERKVYEKREDLYTRFWSLQDIFRDPTQLFEDDKLTQFKKRLIVVLDALKDHDSGKNGNGVSKQRQDSKRKPTVAVTARNTPAPHGDDDNEKEEDNTENDENMFVPKWLTKRDLFELQLNDHSFRQTFNAQVIMLCKFLARLTASGKKSSSEKSSSNRAVNYSFTVSDEDGVVFENLATRLLNSESIAFERTMKQAISAEYAWAAWKLMNCPPFERTSVDSEQIEKDETDLIDFSNPRKKFWHKMGTKALSTAWKIETGMDKINDGIKNGEKEIKDNKEFYERTKELKNEIKEERKENDEDVRGNFDSVEWVSMRAARQQSMWSEFGAIIEGGLGALYGEPELKKEQEEEQKDKPVGSEPQNGEHNGGMPANEPQTEIGGEPSEATAAVAEPEGGEENNTVDIKMDEVDEQQKNEEESGKVVGMKRAAEDDDDHHNNNNNVENKREGSSTPSKRLKTEDSSSIDAEVAEKNNE